MAMGWFEGALRDFFFMIDKGVYGLLEAAYNIITEIAQTQIFKEGTITTFTRRIYVLIGVFMLFKVAFSLISMFLNPDSFSDAKSGGGKLIQRIAVSLIMLVMVPFVFEKAYDLQDIVINDNILPSIILGGATDPDHTKQTYQNAGKMISVTVFKSFFRNDGTRYQEDASVKEIYEADASSGITIQDFSTLVRSGRNNRFYFDYSILLSSIAGGLIAWIMIMFCFDVAVRTIKLGFLQLIAPIPVLSYIDTKKGDKVFQTWLTTCISTYLDLFMRFIAIYFVVFVLSELTGEGGIFYGGLDNANVWVRVFVIFGLLLFAKEAPQLIYDILGIKQPKKGFTLNPFNKLQQVPLVGWASGQVVGRTAGAYEAALHDQSGHPIIAAAGGFFGAGDELKGKIKMMGNDAGAQTVRPLHTGISAGYEIATGNKYRSHAPLTDLFKGRGEKDKEYYKGIRGQLQNQLSDVQLRKNNVSEAYNDLSERWRKASDPKEKQELQRKMEEAREYWNELSKVEGTLNGKIGVANDQIKDVERRFNLDKSPMDDLNEIEDILASDKNYLQRALEKDGVTVPEFLNDNKKSSSSSQVASSSSNQDTSSSDAAQRHREVVKHRKNRK